MKDNIENSQEQNNNNIKMEDFNLSTSRSPRTSNVNNHEFKLIECEKWSSEEIPPPFRVSISVEVLCIIDVHAHCSTTEVIGFLGGKYCSTFKELRILSAETCASITASTNLTEVEMDPVSAVEASERIRAAGLSVVGWYHSHPTFVPNPSIRDLKQHAFCQKVYRTEDNPFIALILSPYCPSSPKDSSTLMSVYKCLMVSDEISTYGSTKFNLPYEFDPVAIRQEKLLTSVLTKTLNLIHSIRGRKSTRCMTSQYSKAKLLTFVDKLSLSLRHHLKSAGLSKVEAELIVQPVFQIVTENLDTDNSRMSTRGTTTSSNSTEEASMSED